MIKQILFDFDGVIIDSMHVRDEGFRTIVEGHDEALIDKFIAYHRYNAGLSRYVKIRYFYETLLGKTISDNEVNVLANKFSHIMKQRLVSSDILISETIDFIKNIHEHIPLHIVSGSDEQELNFLCKKLNIDNYFVTIKGSPTPKNELVKNIMNTYNYNPKETLLIGDSINDYDAAKINGLYFVGFNNENLSSVSDLYVDVIDNKILDVYHAY